jgi:hypothetical protein
MIVVEYAGWEIHAYRQIHYPPFLDFTATCWQGNVMRFGGIEGRTVEEAIERAKRTIERNRL